MMNEHTYIYMYTYIYIYIHATRYVYTALSSYTIIYLNIVHCGEPHSHLKLSCQKGWKTKSETIPTSFPLIFFHEQMPVSRGTWVPDYLWVTMIPKKLQSASFTVKFRSTSFTVNVNPGLINHGLLIRGYASNSHSLILKWYPPN